MAEVEPGLHSGAEVGAPCIHPYGSLAAIAVAAKVDGFDGSLEWSGVIVERTYLAEGVETHQMGEMAVAVGAGRHSYPFLKGTVVYVDAVIKIGKDVAHGVEIAVVAA